MLVLVSLSACTSADDFSIATGGIYLFKANDGEIYGGRVVDRSDNWLRLHAHDFRAGMTGHYQLYEAVINLENVTLVFDCDSPSARRFGTHNRYGEYCQQIPRKLLAEFASVIDELRETK